MMKPILVTGGNRTGTSWVGQTLCFSSELFYVWEPFNCMFPVPLFKHPFTRHYRRVLPEESASVKRHVKRKAFFELISATPGGHGLMPKIRKTGLVTAKLTRWLTGRLTPLYKDPIALMSAEWFQDEFDAWVVMVVRHPGAYVNSIKRLNWPMCVEEFACQPLLMESLPVYLQEEIHGRIAARPRPRGYVAEDAALCWKVFHQVVHQYSESHPDWIVVGHEDLSLNYISGFKDLYEKLGLTWTAEIEAKIHMNCSPENSVVQGDVCHHFRQDSASLTRLWRNVLTPEEQNTVREVTDPVSSLFYNDDSWN